MKIKVVGSGCPTCEALHELVKEVVKEKNIDAEIEYSTDIAELVNAGAMGSPGLFKNGELINVGMPSRANLINLLETDWYEN